MVQFTKELTVPNHPSPQQTHFVPKVITELHYAEIHDFVAINTNPLEIPPDTGRRPLPHVAADPQGEPDETFNR